MKNAVCPLEFEALARRNKKEWLLEFSQRKARKPRKVVWFVPPCSRRSRCSRFIEFKRSVRCNSDEKITAKRAKTANKKGSVPRKPPPYPLQGTLLLSVSSCHRETLENCESLYVCFTSFVPFALFAVHEIQRECPL